MVGAQDFPRAVLGVLLLLPLMVGCQSGRSLVSLGSVSHTIPPSWQIPRSVERLAVLYEQTRNREEREAYHRLDGAVFQFKELRPSLRIIERSNLRTILGEQQFQLGGPVLEETAVRVGRLLGVDSVLIYHIEGPSLRDQMIAKSQDALPPILVTSKIIEVQSAEVLFHNVVTSPIEEACGRTMGRFGSQASVRPLMREALNRGVDRTISDLRHAFR